MAKIKGKLKKQINTILASHYNKHLIYQNIHLYKLTVMFQLLLQCLDMLVEVFSVGLVVQLRLQALGFLLFQISLQGPEALRQRPVVPLRLPLQVQSVLGQKLRL